MTWKGKPSTRKGRLRAAGVSGWEYSRQIKRVLERDGYRCYLRGPDCIGRATVADHVVPLYKGGAADESNMRAACVPCHKGKTKQETRESQRPRPRNQREPEPHPGLLRPDEKKKP